MTLVRPATTTPEFSSGEGPRNVQPFGSSVNGDSADAELRFTLERAMAQLEAGQREAFLLKHVEQLSYEEMSAATGVKISALKMRVQRACDRLQILLEEDRHA